MRRPETSRIGSAPAGARARRAAGTRAGGAAAGGRGLRAAGARGVRAAAGVPPLALLPALLHLRHSAPYRCRLSSVLVMRSWQPGAAHSDQACFLPKTPSPFRARAAKTHARA